MVRPPLAVCHGSLPLVAIPAPSVQTTELARRGPHVHLASAGIWAGGVPWSVANTPSTEDTIVKRLACSGCAKPWPTIAEISARSGCQKPPTSTTTTGLSCRRSEEHTSELSHGSISYAVFCLKKKKKTQ